MDAEQRPGLSQRESAGTEQVLDEQSLPQFRMGEPSLAAPLTPRSVVPTSRRKPRDLGGCPRGEPAAGPCVPTGSRRPGRRSGLPGLGEGMGGGQASFGETKHSITKSDGWDSPGSPGLRFCLPMQGTRARSLGWEDPTSWGATKPERPRARALQLETSRQ